MSASAQEFFDTASAANVGNPPFSMENNDRKAWVFLIAACQIFFLSEIKK